MTVNNDTLEFHARRLIEHYDMAQNADHKSCFQDAVHCLRDKLDRIAAAPKPDCVGVEEVITAAVEWKNARSGDINISRLADAEYSLVNAVKLLAVNEKAQERGEGIAEAAAKFTAKYPTWWFTIGVCDLTRDFTCAPQAHSPEAVYIQSGNKWDGGFSCDHYGTIMDAVDDVMAQIESAQGEYNFPVPKERESEHPEQFQDEETKGGRS